MVHSEAITKLDNLTKKKNSFQMQGFLHEMRKCCAENRYPRIETEFEFDMFCFGICLAPYAVFSSRIYLQHIARSVESDRPINIVFVLPFFRGQFMNVGP